MYFEWVKGRTLSSIVFNDGEGITLYVTNADGVRTNKDITWFGQSITNTNYNYEYNGNLLVRQSWNNNVMWFLYDESGNPVGFTLNDTAYYYLKNLQGDITAITDANGNIVAKYSYDEWGKPLSITDGNGNDVSANASHIANVNPLRYRGYYYDSETGFYYLLTRYYDPVTRRFINADGQLNTDSLLGFNMFAYCENNPVIYSDPCGTCVHRWDFWNDCDKCTPTQTKEEKKWFIKYNVPLYNQGNHGICWAVCQIMMEDFKAGKRSIGILGYFRAYLLALNLNGEENLEEGGWPTNCAHYYSNNTPIPSNRIDGILSLYLYLKTNGPVYALYTDDVTSHLVVVTGVDVRNRIVYTNNPHGIRGAQSYWDFLRGYTGGETDGSYSLRCYYEIA